MKRTGICPKCQNGRLWHIERVQERDEGHPIALAISVEVGWWGTTKKGTFELFICEKCRYAEWYATSLEGLREDPKRGIRLVENQNPEGGPYR